MDKDRETLLDQETLQAMADLALESLKQENRIDWEPYELFAQKLNSLVTSDPQKFRSNFKEGFEALNGRVKE